MKRPKLKDVKIDAEGTKKIRSRMANRSSISKQRNIARNADELGELLGLTPSETAIMKNKAKISRITAKKSSSIRTNKCVLIVESKKESMSRAFSELKKPSGKYKGMTIISFPDYETLGRVVTGACLELIAVVRRDKPNSIKELAKLVGRDFKDVYQDVKLLAEFGLLAIQGGGSRKSSTPVAKFREIAHSF